MKILHTADWHIGKKLQKHELKEDFDLFIEWLCATIKSHEIEVLLVSGDIFDLANPSSEARTQYYKALLKLRNLNCKIILTGGNHDSPAMLDAPQEILRNLDIEVIGGLPKDISQTLIPVKNKAGNLEFIVAALPYLRDTDLRKGNEGVSYDDRLEAIREGIASKFNAAAEICKTSYPNIPVIAMGHLYAAGIETSDSERDIQIGNQAAFQASQFGEYFKYIALGHIHKPQRVNALVPTFYSGSPIPLSFSERKDEKRVLILDTSKSWEPESIPVPSFRKLIRISGNLAQLTDNLYNLPDNDGLDHLIEVVLKEPKYDVQKIYQFDQLTSQFEKNGYQIVKNFTDFDENLQGTSALYESNQQLEDLKPKDVFIKLVDQQDLDQEDKQDILSAFDEILEEVQNPINS
ncbi:exonuclease subunit SbcD [Leeuwenhoekiella sp. A16]|uniref:exonuclease subunit SbcD n=1 Tax=Leeuwenhoekiella sp. A16 TaxID=3141462 RepID=UPI003A806E11